MKKNKTTKPTKKSYSSVKEVLEDNNSKIKLTPFNCKEAKFGKIIEIDNPYNSTGKFDFIFRRASTSEKFFDGIENQRPNQILWNEEEKQAYFLNPDRQLYRMVFEPVPIKEQCLKQQIKSIAIPWSKFHNPNPDLFDKTYDTRLLTPMFIDILDLVKEKTIKVTCGVAMMQLLSYYANYCSFAKKIDISGCEIIPELDFNLPKYDMAYKDICIVGPSVPEKDNNEVAEKDFPPKKKKSIWERIFG